MRIFTSEGNEVLHYGGCDPHEHVYGEVVEVSFEGSSYLTIVLHTEHEWSHVRSEFCVLEEGKSLSSGLCVTTVLNSIFNLTPFLSTCYHFCKTPSHLNLPLYN